MKKCTAFILALCMVFSIAACGTEESVLSASSEKEIVSVPEETAAPAEPTAEPEPEPMQEETSAEEAVVSEEPEMEASVEEPVGFYNPLTGEATETDISGNRPYAAMLNTIKQALPQSSNSQADMLIEATEEGGITRVMGIYQDLSGIGNIGTIRSTREYFVYLAMGLDALLIHAGCSVTADEELDEHDYATVNFLGSASSAFWRDQWRKENIASEHSLYTSAENVQNFTAKNGYRTTHEDGFQQPYEFTEDGTPENGQSALELSAEFSSYKTTKFVYDEETKTYQVFAYGEAYMDEATDAQVTVTNVVIIPTEQTDVGVDGLQRFDLSEGTGYYACGGKYIPIRWEKGGEEAPLCFYHEDGSLLKLGVGKTYICILGDDRPVSIQ